LKHILLTAVFTCMTASAAFAMNNHLSSGTQRTIQKLVPEADLAIITNAQAIAIENVLLFSGRAYSNPLDQSAAIRQILKPR